MANNGEEAWTWNIYKDCVLNDITTSFSGKKEGGNLYDIQTIGDVASVGLVTESPVVSVAQAENQNVVVAVDSLVTVLEETGQVYNATIDLGCCIDALCLVPDGQILIATDRSGVLHFVSTGAGKHIFSRRIVASDSYTNGDCGGPLFCSVSCVRGEDGLHSIAVGLCSGRFFIFSDVDFGILEKAHQTNNTEIVKEMQAKMRVREYDASAIHTKCMTGVFFYDDGFCSTFYTVGCGDRIIALWQLDADPLSTLGTDEPVAQRVHSVKCDLFYNSADAKVVKAVHVVNHLYTLDCMGCLHQWNAEDLMLNRFWDDMRIVDFTIKVSSFAEDSSEKLFAIVSGDVGLEFKVYDLPSMKQCYSTSCKKEKCYSLAMCPPDVDNVIFVDGSQNFTIPGSCLFMHCVVEASPDDRLIRLLSNRRFDEAEKFAVTFGLDTQQVYRQKAVFLSSSISAVADETLATTYDRLKECLLKVDDPATVGEICLEAMVPNVQMSYELLALGGARLREVTGRRLANGGTRDHEEDLKIQIINRIDRLVTFRMIHDGSATDSGDEWLHFCNADLPDELTRLLTAGNIQAAAIVLLRHKSSFLSFLTATGSSVKDNSMVERRLQAFLECIPQNADLNAVVAWLEESVVPTVLAKLSFGLPVISSWLLARAESFEQYDPAGWPENGLKMANVLFNVQSKLASAGFLSDQVSCVKKAFKSTSTEVANLRLLASRLQLLLQLKQRYQCNITLTEFIQETTMSLTYRMLDRVMVPELIVPTLERTVKPYMREHDLNEEEVLLGYVEDLLSRFQNQAWGSVESLKERKVVAIVKCMKRPLVVLKATVKLAKKALVPWSQDVSDLVENGLKLCSTDTGVVPSMEGIHSDDDRTEMVAVIEQFRKELEYRKHVERLPSILAEYGLSKVEVSAHLQIIRFLVRRDTPEAMLQAFHFCHTFTTFPDIDVYRYRLMFLLQTGRAADCVELLKQVKKTDEDMAVLLVKHSITFAESMLSRVDSLFETERLTYCDVAIQMIKYILHDFDGSSNIENRAGSEFELYLREELDVLSNIMMLQTKYNELLTVEQYVSKPHRARVLSNHISKLGMGAETTASVSAIQESSGDSTAIDTTGLEKVSKPVSQDVQVDFSHVLNVARILGVESDQLQKKVAVHMSKKGKSMAKSALGVCRELIQMSPLGGAAETTIRVVLELLRHSSGIFTSEMKLVSEVLEVASMALTYLEFSDIGRAIQLNLFLILLDEVNRVTDSDDDLLFCQQGSTSKNPLKTVSTLHPWMEQRGGLMLRLQQIVPLLSKMTAVFSDKDFMECRHMSEAKVAESVSNLRSIAVEITTALKHGQQSQLALQWLLFCIRTTMCHVAGKQDLQDGDKNLSGRLLAIVEEGAKIVPEHVEDGAKRVLGGSKEVDVGYVVGLLTMVPISRAQSLLEGELSRAASNYKRIMNVTSAGIAMLKLNSMQSQVKKYQHLFLDSKWGETLRPLKISFEKVLFSPPNLKSCLLPNMLHHPQVTGKIVNEFCIDYGLDRTAALLDFTRVLLSDPSCTITHGLLKTPTQVTGGRQLIWEETTLVSPTTLAATHFNLNSHLPVGTKGGSEETAEEGEPKWNRPWQDVKNEVAYVMNNIGDRNGMCRQLIRILRHETSPYYYKRIKFILNLIAECNTVQSEVNVERGIGLVDCLKHIKRSSVVSDFERQYWNQHAENYTSLALPGISKQRLPVHPLLFSDSSSAWKILTPELNERSATRLVPVARLLSLSINKLYVTAAENFIRSHMDKTATHQLALTPQRLKDIRNLLKEVDDLRMSTAMAKRIAELLPVSPTKVEAYEWCELVSKTWLESLDEVHHDYAAVANMHKSLSACRRHTAIELVLHEFKLSGQTLNMLIPSPEKLICALYQHQSVIERYYKPDIKEYPDVHQAADKIAEISSVNVFKLRISISTDLLFSASLSKSGAQDDDVTTNLANMKATSILESGSRNSASLDEDVIRLLYILSHAQTKQTARFLLGFAFNKTNQRVTNACRVRGLQCVLQLFDDELIEELTNEKVSTIREKLRILVYLSELESIGFSISGSRLQKGDKDGVARSILASPELRHSARAVRIAAELCREYESWCPETWQMILQQMVSSRQIGYLRHLLPDVCCHAGISSLSCLPSVWQSCVTFPLAAMTPPLTQEEVTVALDSYHFLIACPVLLQVDLVGVAKHFVRTDLPLLALGCLLCDPSRDTQSRELGTAQQDAIRDQLQQYPQILGRNQILEVLERCKRK